MSAKLSKIGKFDNFDNLGQCEEGSQQETTDVFSKKPTGYPVMSLLNVYTILIFEIDRNLFSQKTAEKTLKIFILGHSAVFSFRPTWEKAKTFSFRGRSA